MNPRGSTPSATVRASILVREQKAPPSDVKGARRLLHGHPESTRIGVKDAGSELGRLKLEQPYCPKGSPFKMW
jgi:hypothetical protein